MGSDLARRMTVWWAGVLCLPLLVQALHPGPTFAAENGATLQQRLESATVLRTFNDGGPVRGSSVAQNRVGLVLAAPESSTALICDFDGTVRFRHTVLPTLDGSQYGVGKYGGIGGVVLSEDGSTFIISVVSGYESYGNEVYSIDGTLLFAQKNGAALEPSPHGRYFCTHYDEIETYALAILDRNGKQIIRFNEPWQWNCQFLDDDRLVVVDKDSLRFIESATGRVEMALPLNFEQVPLFHSRNLPHLVLSRTHRVVAAYDERNLLIISVGGKELRRQVFTDLLCAIAFDDSRPRMVMQMRDWPATYGYFVVTPIDSAQPAIESAHMLKLARTGGPQNLPAMWFSAGIISYWMSVRPSDIGAPLPAVVAFEPGGHPATLFLTFDSETGFSGEAIEQPGFYCPVDRTGSTRRYLLASAPGTIRLISAKLGPDGTGKAR